MEFSMEDVDKYVAEQDAKRPKKEGNTRKFTNEPVDPGVYELEIKRAPVVKVSKAGNLYMELFLTHTEQKGAAGVNHIISLSSVGAIQLSQLLLNIGFEESELRTSPFGFEAEDEAELASTNISGATIKVGGKTYAADDLVGRKVNVYLTKKEESYDKDGETITKIKNRVARFNAS